MPKRKRKTGTKKTSTEEEEEEIEEETPTEVKEKEPSPPKVTGKKEKTSPLQSDVKHGFIPTPKIWPDHLTKYERSRIIGARALQISMGAPILVAELLRIKNPVEVSEKELDYGILPLTIRRILPDGDIVDVPLSDLLEED